MKAIILAAGKGVRMRPLTLKTPKFLVKVGGKPIADYIFEALPDEVTDVIVVTKYLGDKIKKHIGNRYCGRRIRYVSGSSRGTAYSLLAAKKLILKNERFFIIHGDELPGKSKMRQCLDYEFSWLCRYVTDPSQSGVALVSPRGRILKVVEKPDRYLSNLAVSGVMLVNTTLFKYKPMRHKNGEYFLTSMMSQFVKEHAVYTVVDKPDIFFNSPADIDRF